MDLYGLAPRLGWEKAIVAVVRKLLIAVWHVWHEHTADRFADDTQVACSMFALAYRMRVKNLPDGQSALGFTRNQLDRLRLGRNLTRIPWGTKIFKLPPSRLADK